jgi:uncharacterized protein
MVSSNQSNSIDYVQLVKFLLQPFLTATDQMAIDCEYTLDRHRIWIRVAVATDDQGTVFGRGGRNLQAIRTVVGAAATAVGQSIHLDVYGSNSSSRDRDGDERRSSPPSDRPPASKPTRRAENGNGEERPKIGDSPSLPPPRPRR